MKKELILGTTLLLLIIASLNIGCGDGTSNSNDSTSEQGIWQKPPGTTVVAPAAFGNPSATGCNGRGVCSGGPGSGATLAVSFNANATKDTITVWFLLADDTANGSSQKKYFSTNADTTYAFEMPCDVSNQSPLFANTPEWTLGSGYIIPPGVTFNTQYNAPSGDEIFTIPIVNVTPQVLHVVFGGTTANGQYNPTARGIYKVSKDPIQAGGGAPPSIPVTFALAPVLPGSQQLLSPNLIMYFESAKLGAIQPQQQANFNCGTASIMFSKSYPLSNSMFSFLYLPHNAQIMAGPNKNTLACGNGWDTVRCTYGFACTPDTLVTEGTNGCLVTSTTSEINVDLTHAHRCLYYVAEYRVSGTTTWLSSNDPRHWPANSIVIKACAAATNYDIRLKEFQADNSTSCESNLVQIATK